MSRGPGRGLLALSLVLGCGDGPAPTPSDGAPSQAAPADEETPAPSGPPAPPSELVRDADADPAPNPPPSGDDPANLADGDRQPWQLDELKISAAPPPDSTVQALQAGPEARLEYALGDASDGDRLWIEPACPGRCSKTGHADRIRADAEKRREAVGGTWIAEPTETEPGVWTYRIAGEDGGAPVELVHALHVPADHDRLLRCHARLPGPARSRAESLLGYCATLKFRVEDPVVRPNYNFHEQYELGGMTLRIPSPTGWRFTRYRRGEEVAFHNRRPTSKIVVRAGCEGECEQPRLDNVKAAALQRESRWRGKAGTSTTGLEEVVPGVFRLRIEARTGGGPRLEVDAFALPGGSDRVLRCSAEVEGKIDFEHRETLDRWCVTVVRGALTGR